MIVRINFRKIAYFCVLFVFCPPPLFSSHPSFAALDSALDILRIFCFLLILLHGFSNSSRLKRMLKPILWVLFFWGSQMLMTVLNHGNVINASIRFICMMAILCTGYIAIKEHYLDYLETVTLYLSALCVMNLVAQIIYPEGFVSQTSMYGDRSPIWILGGENTMISYIMPAMTLQGIRYAQTNRKSYLILIALSAASIILSGSATAIIGLCLFLLIFIPALFLGTNQLSSIFNINNYIIATAVAVVLFVVVGSFDVFRVIIVDLLGKDMTLTTRSVVWARIIDSITEKPILGHGIMYVDIFRNRFGVSHQHNYYLNILHQGGVFSLVAFLLLLNRSRKRLSIHKGKKEVYILSAGLFCFFVMFISEVYGDVLLFYVLLLFSVRWEEDLRPLERRP